MHEPLTRISTHLVVPVAAPLRTLRVVFFPFCIPALCRSPLLLVPSDMSFKCPEFKFVTVGCLQEWKASNSNFKLPEPVSMIRFLYELCWAMIRGELPFQKCKLALDSATFLDGKKEEIGSMLVDIIAHLGQDLTIPAEYCNCLTKMEKWFAESSLVPTRLLQERCEEEFLWESELSKLKANDLKSKEIWATKHIGIIRPPFPSAKSRMLRWPKIKFADDSFTSLGGHEQRCSNISG